MAGYIIYHNPRCTKSRQTVALLEEKEVEFSIVEYLNETPGVLELRNILSHLDLSARDVIRKSEAIYKELGLNDESLSEMDLIKAMKENPILIERPIVVNTSTQKAAIGRPPENILAIL